MLYQRRGLLDAFNELFEVIPAATPELREQVHRLRYHVICVKMQMPGYEPERFPDGQEVDEYDERSAHCLLRHRPTGKWAGTVRLILSDRTNPSAPFPIEKVAGDHCPASHLPRTRTAEISRFIVYRSIKSRELGQDSDAYDDLSRHDRYCLPLLGLLRAIVQMSVEHRITHWYAIFEPTLNRLVARWGWDFQAIGPVIQYNGERQPHLSTLPAVLEHVYRKRQDVWNLVTDEGALWPVPGAQPQAPSKPLTPLHPQHQLIPSTLLN